MTTRARTCQIHGVRVVEGTTRQLTKLVEEHAAEEVIIAIPSVQGSVVQDIVTMCKKANVSVRTLPGVYELIKGSVTIEQLREVQVEDILGRGEITVDLADVAADGAGTAIRSRWRNRVGRGGAKGVRLAGRFQPRDFDHCRRAGVDLVAMAGFLKRVTIPADFAGRVVDIYPALMPAFCGEGFYGHAVHEAVLEYGAKLSGCTVHFADNQYDHGPVILQRAVPVLDDDMPARYAGRPRVRGRMRGISRGAAAAGRRASHDRRPSRANWKGAVMVGQHSCLPQNWGPSADKNVCPTVTSSFGEP